MIQLSLLLTGLIQGLRRVIARAAPVVSAPARPIWAGPEQRWIIAPHGDLPLLPGPIWTLLCLRLQRLNNRLTRLYERWQTNTLPKPRPKTTRPTATRPETARHPRAPERIQSMPMPGADLVEAPARLPRGRGWITRRIPEAGPSAGWLEHLLQQPHTQEFVQAAPQAGRLLRPLCHALGLDQPDWLKRAPRPRKPRTPRPSQPRRLKLTDPILKLRPYEIAAARYFIKKYGREG
ncbi:MAG: hypothetical protein NTY94_21365 [Alphaproteobacteria bacterium]|nr:hypothetical protein [Alphaproteobacteria bacterium]